MEYCSAFKKEILPFATTWMKLEGILLSEMNQIQKDKYCMISYTYEVIKMLISFIVTIISQHTNTSKDQVIHGKYIQFYLSVTPQ